MSLSFYMQFTYTSFFLFFNTQPYQAHQCCLICPVDTSFLDLKHSHFNLSVLQICCWLRPLVIFFLKCILDSTVFSLTKLSFEITSASLYLTRTSTYRSEHETFALADPLLRLPASAFPFWTPVFASCCHPHIYMHQLRKWIEHNSHVHRYHIILNFYMKNMIFHSLRILSAIKIHPLNLLPSV